MKGFKRSNPLFSLCGLNCGLCPMKAGGHCSGCGFGNQSCRIAKCSLEHGGVEYCFQCEMYPCEKYEGIDDFDSFITHQRQKSDMEKAKRMGITAYNQEQEEKAKALDALLSCCNDGRRKAFYRTAVNLLEMDDISGVLNRAQAYNSVRERAEYVVKQFKELAQKNNIVLALRKKKG